MLAQSESVFALSNGHIGLRGNLDEGEPYGLPGTYLNGFHELRPLPYPEGGFGYPESSQSVVNVTNGKIIRLLVDDEPFDVRYGTLHGHERVLDLRDGVLRREVDWSSPAGRRVRVASTRLVSLAQRSIAAVLWEVEPLDGATRGDRRNRSSSPTRPLDGRRPTGPAGRGPLRVRSMPSTFAHQGARRLLRTPHCTVICAWRPRWTTRSTPRPTRVRGTPRSGTRAR